MENVSPQPALQQVASPPQPGAIAQSPLTSPSTPTVPSPLSAQRSGDLGWVWREVRKRVFLKLPFSRTVAEALEAVMPITLDGATLVCGMSTVQYPMSVYLMAPQVRNTIEGILRQASDARIHFELIEGTTLEDWREIKERRANAQEAVIAMATQTNQLHHYEAILNQAVGEIRQRITAKSDRIYLQVRAQAMFEVVPLLADTGDMLFPDRDAHDARRAMARAIDRVANFLDMPALTLAIEIERYQLANARPKRASAQPEKSAELAANG